MATAPVDLPGLPARPIDQLTAPLRAFLRIESAGGVLLLLATAVALIIANSPAASGWAAFWKHPVGLSVGGWSLVHPLYWWVNDLLMAVFFFVVGLEIKRELLVGELADLRRASLPVAAALGGALLPAVLFLAMLRGQPGANAWAVPMATDIAFVVGALALLGDRVPRGLKVALLSLAIVDDLLAVAVIALFYSEAISLGWLSLALAGLVVHAILARLGVRSFLVFGLVGLAVWLATLGSGLHPTVAGVFLGLATPMAAVVPVERAREALAGGIDRLRVSPDEAPGVLQHLSTVTREAVSPALRLEHALHPWTAFAVMPLFALANAGVALSVERAVDPVAAAIAVALVVGKPVGILSAAWLAVRVGLGRLPDGVTWPMLVGGGLLCGIGFTMSLFIAGLALNGPALDAARTGVLVASAVASASGMLVTAWAARVRPGVA